MNKSSLAAIWDQMRQKYGVYLRVLEALPEDKVHATVIAGMRTPAELVAHTSEGIVRDFAQGVARGEITQPRTDEEMAATIESKADLIGFARERWEQADAAIAEVGDDELSRMVQTPWNFEFPGGTAIHVLNDEFMHHRGQLYAYVRASGGEPPFIWSYAENAPGFGPNS